MNDRLFIRLKSKSGMTMLEVVAAVCILAIVVLAAVTAVKLSHSTVLSQGSSANAAAQAQDIADELITKLHTEDPDSYGYVIRMGDGTVVANANSYLNTFPDPALAKQFYIDAVKDTNGIVIGYKIRTAVYYTDSSGKKCVQMQAFSAKDGG